MAKQKNKEPKIRQYYKPSDKELELLERVYDRYRSMKDNPMRQEAVKEWDKGEKAWDQAQEEDKNLEDWQADYYVPMTTSIVETILSEMVDQSPRPIILPRASEDKPRATVMKHTFEYTWDVADGDEELENVLKDCLIYGNGFAQEYYWKDRRMIKTVSKSEKNKKKQKLESYNETERFDFDDCYMESVSPYELFFDEVARSINRGPYKARDAIRRYVMKLDAFKQVFKGDVWDPLNNARLVRAGGDTNWYSYYKPPEDVDKSDEVEVLWYWSRTPDDWLIIVANDVLIKAGPNPYKHKQLPFAMTIDVKRPHKFYHKGEPKLLEAVQKEVNVMRRMLTDRNHLDIDKMWLISRSESYNEEDTIARPHGTIRVDDPANYKPIDYADVGNSFFMSLQEINRDAERITGVEGRTADSRPAMTATDAAILKERVVRRIGSKLRRLEKGFLVDIGRMRVANILQFYSQPKLERILGEAGTEEYRKQMMQAKKQGILHEIDKVPFKETYRDIRVKGKVLKPNSRGEITEYPQTGYSFFNLKPEYFMPVASGGFDIRFEAGATMPVSKSLLAKQTQDMVAGLMPLATAGIGYDPVKLGDEMIRSLEKDPEDFHIEEIEKDITDARQEMEINVAGMENDEVSKGRPIPPAGTPYATSAHTMIHIGFMRSSVGKQMAEPDFKRLTQHVIGEITAQQMRGEATALTGEGQTSNALSGQNGASPPQGSVPPASSDGANAEMKAANPTVIQGGEEVQGGQKGSLATKIFGLLGRKR
jgi:hypothetical protein